MDWSPSYDISGIEETLLSGARDRVEK